METPLLSPAQRKTAAVGLTVVSAAATLLFVGALLWLAARFLAAFSGVFVPLAVAAILALVLQPFYAWLRGRLRLPPVIAVLTVYAAVGLPFVAFFWFFGALLVREASDLFAQLPHLFDRAQSGVQRRWPEIMRVWHEHHLGPRLAAALREHGDWVTRGASLLGGTALAAGQGAARIAAAAMSWIVLPVYVALLLMAEPLPAGKLEAALPFLKPETRRDGVHLAREFVAILVSFFRGQLVIAMAQGVLLGLGFAGVGLTYGLTLGLVFGCLNIVPYLGSMLTVVVTLPLAWLQPGGGPTTLLLVAAVIVAVQMIEAYVLTPRIMGSRTGLPPLVIMVAIFFWGTALGGIAGMILAIPLTAFLFVFWRLAKAKYIKAIV